MPLGELKSWEAGELERRQWTPQRGATRERVAGLFVTAAGWSHPVSWLPEASIDFVARRMLPRVIDSRCFSAVGLSRDGVTEKGENAAWFALVAQARRAGLRVYLKPGDGELTQIREREEIRTWAKACFDVPAPPRNMTVNGC